MSAEAELAAAQLIADAIAGGALVDNGNGTISLSDEAMAEMVRATVLRTPCDLCGQPDADGLLGVKLTRDESERVAALLCAHCVADIYMASDDMREAETGKACPHRAKS